MGEGLTIEFKASFPKNATEIAHDIAAFSNTQGGTILVGVDDQGNTVGVANADETMQRIVGAANSICNPPLRPAMGKVVLESDKLVVWVTVSKNCDFLTLVNGKCYVRSGPVAVPVEDSSELQKLLPQQRKRRYRALYALIVLSLTGVLAMLLIGHRFFPSRRENSLKKVAEAMKAFDLAVSYEAQGDDEQAISALKDAMESDPTLGEAYLRAAYICQQDDWYDQASDFIKQAKQSPAMQDPTFARRFKAMKLYLEGNTEEAVEEFKLLADVAPKDAYVLYYYADLAWEMGRFDEAESALEKCLATSPLDPLCNFDTMMLRVSQNRFDDALHNYESLTKKSVYYPWFDVPAGLTLLGKDDVDGAEKKLSHFAEASKRFHGSVHFTTAQEYRMDLLTYQGRLAEARALAQELGVMEKPEERSNPLLDMAVRPLCAWMVPGARLVHSSPRTQFRIEVAA
jgi:tetratricopeptide (TPR) repeat protein